jgi:hypothetical protein
MLICPPLPLLMLGALPPVPTPVAGDIVVFEPPGGDPPVPDPAPGDDGPESEHAAPSTHANVHSTRIG